MAGAGSRAARRALVYIIAPADGSATPNSTGPANSSAPGNSSAPSNTTGRVPPQSYYASPPLSPSPWTSSVLWYVGLHLAIGAFLCLVLAFFYLWGRRMRRMEAEAAAAREGEEGGRGEGASEGGVGGPAQGQGQQSGVFHAPGPGRGLDPALLPLLPQKVFKGEARLEQSQLEEPALGMEGGSALGSAPFAGAASSKRAPDIALLNECSVCLSEYEHGDIVKWVPACGHAFHGSCIESWLGSRTTCPLCRMQVAPSLQALGKASEAENAGHELRDGSPGGAEA